MGLTAMIASDRASESFTKKFSKKLLTVGYLDHIWLFTDEHGPKWSGSLALHQSAIRCPGNMGEVRCRLFDIVGLDEGTCGRRLRSLEVLRLGLVG